MNNIRMEKMIVDDIPRIYELELEIFKDDPGQIEWFYEGVPDPEGHWYVAYLGDEIVGYCGMYHITSKEPNYCKISSVAVREHFRQKGIGRMMMLKMLDVAKELGLDRAMLEVSIDNKSAVGLYKSLGFEIVEFKEKYYEKNGKDAYIMWYGRRIK